MASYTYKTALITGASSGIGKEFALALAKQHGWNMILAARDVERLKSVKESIHSIWKASSSHGSITARVDLESVDLASQTARHDLLQRLAHDQRNIDLLINNAGVACQETFSSSDIDMDDQMIDVNCVVPVHLCQTLLPGMLARRSGSIINVCSTLAAAPMPHFACYAATKTFLLHFSVALAQEVRGHGVKVLALCPGTTDTPGHRSHNPLARKSILGTMAPEKVAGLGLKALEKNSPICVPGILNRFVFGMLCLMPMTLAARIQGTCANLSYR